MNPIQQTLDTLRKTGWIQHNYENNGAHCLEGSLYETCGIEQTAERWDLPSRYADHLLNVEALIADVIVEQYPLYWVTRSQNGSWSTIVRFNDHPDRTFTEVEQILEKAAQRYEELDRHHQ